MLNALCPTALFVARDCAANRRMHAHTHIHTPSICTRVHLDVFAFLGCSAALIVVTDVSRHRVGAIPKGQAVIALLLLDVSAVNNYLQAVQYVVVCHFYTASSVTWDLTLLCNIDIHNYLNILCAAYNNLNILYAAYNNLNTLCSIQ